MKFLSSILFVLILCSCAEEVTETEDLSNNLIEEVAIDTTPDPTAPGQFKEYFPNGALKIEGKNNAEGNRNGLWISYYDNGIKWSESYYDNGIRDGHSLTFFPNGGIRYIGEYKNDIKIGLWKFYDEAGELVKEEQF
ncbi:MAG: antitoxin component YwqK of YwqJK toxin-antitoxin module [Arenicella sp.]|jgi:antitoxin component YwqK of YwqJK toxin-antitoxin module